MYEGGRDLEENTRGKAAGTMGVSMLRSQNRRKCQAASSDRDHDPLLDERAIKLMKHNVNCRPDGRDMVLTAQLLCYV